VKRWRTILKAILIFLILNEIRGAAVVAAVLGTAFLAKLTTGATLLPLDFLR
jgi:hypothetical protein